MTRSIYISFIGSLLVHILAKGILIGIRAILLKTASMSSKASLASSIHYTWLNGATITL